jgi:antitoxin FitA
MAQILVRNLEDQLKLRLQRRARRHGRSMEEEARDILRNALRSESNAGGGLGSEISALFRDHGLDDEIPELRGHTVHPPEFKA